MSILIDEDGQKVYKADGYMSYPDKEIADKLEKLLKKKIPIIEKKISDLNLLELKRKSGAIKLWYRVGIELRTLWECVKRDFNFPDTYLPIFLRAVYDHSDKIKPGSGRSDRFRNSHFFYCHKIAGLPWEKVKAAGNWTAWVEFLDSKSIRDDLRVPEWFASRSIHKLRNDGKPSKLEWFRKITRAIRNELKDIDTTVLEKDELFKKLDSILSKVLENNTP